MDNLDKDNLTIEKAQFILQSFRPDGEDADDVTFKEALELAAKDRELGQWLAEERASDAEFAEALTDVEIPDNLRLQILAVMHGDKLDDPEVEAAMDEFFQEALVDIKPPVDLRDHIIAAMNVQKVVDDSTTNPVITKVNVIKVSFWKKASSFTAIAAAVLLGAILAFNINPSQDGAIATNVHSISSYDVHKQAGAILNTSFKLDLNEADETNINTWLVSNKLPVPSELPAGLGNMKRMGCKEIVLTGGAKASMICFIEDNGGMVHVVVVDSDELTDTALPKLDGVNSGNCFNCPKTGWDVARWQDDTKSYIMMAKLDPSDKAIEQKTMLHYF